MKLLEGKRFKSVASAGDQPRFLLGAFPGRRVSIDFGRRTRVEANVALLGVCYSLSHACDDWDRGTQHDPSGFGASAHVPCLGCWHNGFKRPVLKHGPRSLTCLRVFGCKTRARNESESWDLRRGGHRRPDLSLWRRICGGACMLGPERW